MCVFQDKLIMRPAGDSRPGDEIKKYLFDTYVKDKYYIDFIIDDSSKCGEI